MAKRAKLKILFLSANPSNTSPLKLDEESRAIEHALRRGKYGDRFQFEQHWALRVSDLQSLLLESEPHIVHFSGHGSTQSEIILQDEQGLATEVPRQALKDLFRLLRNNIRCVVLNSCYSQQQADNIAENIDCVVGMSDAIGDEAAIHFSASFYQALAFGAHIEKAFQLGRNGINLVNLREEDKPQLITHKLDPSKIFLINSIEEKQQANDNTTNIAPHKKKSIYRWLSALLLMGIISYILATYYHQSKSISTDTVPVKPKSKPMPYTLPNVPPKLDTVIAIAAFNHCPKMQKKLTQSLHKVFRKNKPTVEIRPLSSSLTSTKITAARTLASDAHLIIWGQCNAKGLLQAINFEIMMARGTPEVYEPRSVEWNLPPIESIDHIVKGMSFYVYRDLKQASATFENMVKNSSPNKQNLALLGLMWGNSLLFSRDYKQAITTYIGAIDVAPDTAMAYLYHNLGVALMNFKKKKDVKAQYQETDNDKFKKALELDPEFLLPHVAMGLLPILFTKPRTGHTQAILDSSMTSCQKGLAAEEDSVIALAKYCLNQLQIVQHYKSSALQSTLMSLRYKEYANNPFWNAPSITQASVDFSNWRINKGPSILVSVALQNALKKSVNDVHTELTKGRHHDAQLPYTLLKNQ